VRYYLVVFNRGDQKILHLTEFEDADTAVRQRFALEAATLESDVEVVVLGAESQEALELTHSRYFGVRPELADA
jgi:hypothetical protein